MTQPVTYKSSGVDIGAGDALVDFLRERLPHIGGFSGLFALPLREYREPLLVASTDGTGTKSMLAAQAEDFSTIGQDLVAMVVNDLIVCGAKPLFFLDYLGFSRLEVESSRQVLQSIIAACELSGCLLLGGETAEMPGFYRDQHVELVGFGVGIVEKSRVIDGAAIAPGDVVLGVPSSGLHSNGYSLARKILFEQQHFTLEQRLPEFDGASLKEVLLRPTEIYTPLTETIKAAGAAVKGYAHITGGGLPGNLNRVLPKNCSARIETGGWQVPRVFDWLGELGGVARDELFRVFNMGIGLTVVCAAGDTAALLRLIRERHPGAQRIGAIVEGNGKVELV